jgi:hypothetical protein
MKSLYSQIDKRYVSKKHEFMDVGHISQYEQSFTEFQIAPFLIQTESLRPKYTILMWAHIEKYK